MPGSSSAINRDFRPQYALKWYFPIAFALLTSLVYIRSKVLAEDLDDVLEIIGIVAIAYTIFFIARAVTRIDFDSSGIRIRRLLWPVEACEYKKILEVRLPEIAIDGKRVIKFDDMLNRDELQQEFKDLEIMGAIQKGRVKDVQSAETSLLRKPKFKDVVWILLMTFVLGNELFDLSRGANALWAIVLVIYFAIEISSPFRKPKDE
ncbi:MAG: hypothetical protein ACOYZ6_15175 [Chloroflexota bacterium]